MATITNLSMNTNYIVLTCNDNSIWIRPANPLGEWKQIDCPPNVIEEEE